MKLYFKQKLFSWFDSYDVFGEDGEKVYTVKGKLSWGHKLVIYDKNDEEVGTLIEKVFSFLPKVMIYKNGELVGSIRKKFSLFVPVFEIDCNGWQVTGSFLEWDYQITERDGTVVADIAKEVFRFTDQYVIDVENERDALLSLMVVLAIDIEKEKRNSADD